MITDLVIMLAFIFGMSLILFLRIGVYGYYFYNMSDVLFDLNIIFNNIIIIPSNFDI